MFAMLMRSTSLKLLWTIDVYRSPLFNIPRILHEKYERYLDNPPRNPAGLWLSVHCFIMWL